MLNLILSNLPLIFLLLLLVTILAAVVIVNLRQRLRSLIAAHEKLSLVLSNKEEVENKLAAEEARFQAMFEDSPDPTWIIDNHQFTLCNLAAVQILGYPS